MLSLCWNIVGGKKKKAGDPEYRKLDKVAKGAIEMPANEMSFPP